MGAARGRLTAETYSHSFGINPIVRRVIAWAAGNSIGPLLFAQSPHDITVFGIVPVVLVCVAIVASWAPALRAAGLDPKTALDAD